MKDLRLRPFCNWYILRKLLVEDSSLLASRYRSNPVSFGCSLSQPRCLKLPQMHLESFPAILKSRFFKIVIVLVTFYQHRLPSKLHWLTPLIKMLNNASSSSSDWFLMMRLMWVRVCSNQYTISLFRIIISVEIWYPVVVISKSDYV